MADLKVADIKKVAVIGAGLMGLQIAEILSRVGKYKTALYDLTDDLVKRGIDTMDQRIDKFFVAKGKLTPEQKKEILGRIEGTSDMAKAVSNADFVIEAILENMNIKKQVYAKLDALAPPNTILASNTSNLNISEMAAVTKRPEKVVGMHFFNPVPVMKLVEVIRGARSSPNTIEVTVALCKALEKEPVICSDASYGFLANRAYGAMIVEAIQMVWERVATPQDIDKAMKLGYNLPMGPLELGDMTGSWGLRVAAEEEALKEKGEKGRVHPLIRLMARAGYPGGLGNKGIYAFYEDVLSKW